MLAACSISAAPSRRWLSKSVGPVVDHVLRPRPGGHRPGAGVVGIDPHCFVEQADCLGIVVAAMRPEIRQRLEHQVVGGEVFGALALGQRDFGGADRRVHRAGDPFGDLVLEVEDVLEHTVIAVGPDMRAAGGVDQLGRDPDAVAGLADAAFEHVAHAELPRHRPDVDRPAFIGIGRVAGDDREIADPRKGRGDLLDDPVGEAVDRGLARHVVERQDGDRRPVGGRRLGFRQRQGAAARHGQRRRTGQRPVRHADIAHIDRRAALVPKPYLELLVHVLEFDPLGPVELRGERLDQLPADRMGDGDSPRRGGLLQADDEAHRRAVAVVALDEHVGQPDADADQDGALAPLIALRHLGLELDRPFDRVLDARELDQRPVAHGLEHVAAMLGDGRPEHVAAELGEVDQRAALVLLDEAREAGHIERGKHRQAAWCTAHRTTNPADLPAPAGPGNSPAPGLSEISLAKHRFAFPGWSAGPSVLLRCSENRPISSPKGMP